MRKFRVLASGVSLVFFFTTPVFAYECETDDGLKFSSALPINEKFSLAQIDCVAETQPKGVSEQLSLYDGPQMASAVISAGRWSSPTASVARIPGAPVRYAAQMEAAARDYDIDPDLLRAVMHVESRGNPGAVSHKGARGLMQIMPATAKRFGVRDPHVELGDPMINIRTGAAYLKTLQGHFGNDLELVLAAYNAGEGAVMKYGRKIPPYRETQGYVTSVLERYRGFVSARGGF